MFLSNQSSPFFLPFFFLSDDFEKISLIFLVLFVASNHFLLCLPTRWSLYPSSPVNRYEAASTAPLKTASSSFSTPVFLYPLSSIRSLLFFSDRYRFPHVRVSIPFLSSYFSDRYRFPHVRVSIPFLSSYFSDRYRFPHVRVSIPFLSSYFSDRYRFPHVRVSIPFLSSYFSDRYRFPHVRVSIPFLSSYFSDRYRFPHVRVSIPFPIFLFL